MQYGIGFRGRAPQGSLRVVLAGLAIFIAALPSADARRDDQGLLASTMPEQPLAAVERRVVSLGLAGDIVPNAVGVQAVEIDEGTIIRDLRPDAAYAFSAMYGQELPSIHTPEVAEDVDLPLAAFDGGFNRAISEVSAVQRASHDVIKTASLPPGGGVDRTKLPNATKEARCLAEALYFEARSESVDGQIAVGEVIITRVESRYYPDTICGVVYQNADRLNRCQFSYACDGQPEEITNQRAWRRAKSLADLLMGGEWRGRQRRGDPLSRGLRGARLGPAHAPDHPDRHAHLLRPPLSGRHGGRRGRTDKSTLRERAAKARFLFCRWSGSLPTWGAALYDRTCPFDSSLAPPQRRALGGPIKRTPNFLRGSTMFRKIAAAVLLLAAGPAAANPAAFRNLVENFERLNSQQIAAHVSVLDQSQLLQLSIYSAFGSLVHLRVCEVYPQAVMDVGGATNCMQTYQSWAQTLQFNNGDVNAATQYAARQRDQLLIGLKCASGEIDAGSCGAYMGTQSQINRRNHEMMMEMIQPSCDNPGGYDAYGNYCAPR